MTGRRPVDFGLLFATLALLLLGLVLVYSASYYLSAKYFDDPAYLLKKQIIAAGIGLALMLFLSRFDYHHLEELAGLMLLGSLGLALLVLVPGVSRGGRWLALGPVQLQPAELLKLALVVYLASSIIRRGEQLGDFFLGVLPYLIILGLAAGLVILQPDFEMALIYGAIVFFMLFIGGARPAHLAFCLLGGLPLVYLLLRASPSHWERIISFLDPFKYGQGKSYQLLQSLVAIGSGGLFGRGLGSGREKLLYLPSAHNDFIASVAGEELGLLGGLLLLLLFGLFIYRGLVILRRAPDQFGFLLSAGLLFTIALQAVVHLGVAVGVLPVTGLTLPFISYGGSSLIVSLGMAGILLNISKQGKEGEFAGLSSGRWERWSSLPRPGDLGGLPRRRGGTPRVYWG